MAGRPSESPRWPPSSRGAGSTGDGAGLPGGGAGGPGPGGAGGGAGAASRPGNLVANLTLFGRRLRGHGFLVGPAEISLGLTALDATDLADREAVRLALRTVLCSRKDDLPVFDAEFARFWSEPVLSAPALPEAGDPESDVAGTPPESRGELSVTGWAEEGTPADDERAVPAYSPAEVRIRKDFSAFSAEDLEAITQVIIRIARRIATRLSRRTRPARRGTLVDLRRTMRRSLQHGGDAADLVWRRRRLRRVKLVLLCDVSGSMDVYSRFLVQFVYALQGVLGRVESFLFSTSLTRVTDALDAHDIRRALVEASRLVPDWSGGTKIGASLRAFLDAHGRRLLDSRTIVIVTSDGWDTGDLDVLVAAMREVRDRAGKVIWLNPLLGSPGYEPVTQGMSAALPFVDVFASAHNLRSLGALERHLRSPRRRTPGASPGPETSPGPRGTGAGR